jgi:zinc/manganese transport system permease protein
MLMSVKGSQVDLLHLLFGSVLAVDDASLGLVVGVTSVSLLLLALLWRPLVVESFDPGFFRAVSGHGAVVHQLFLALVVANLVAGFQALGTLMAVGLLMLPAIAARFWVSGVAAQSVVSALIAAFSGLAGLLLSYHANVPSGPAIVLCAGAVYVASLLLGARDSVRARRFNLTHHRIA